MKKTLHPHPGWARKVVYLQLAVQTAIAVTPFYAVTARAAATAPFDERILSGAEQHVRGLSQDAQSGSLDGFAAQQASGATSQALQQWLSNFGTARVELGTDSRFKPQSGAADLLVPLYKSQNRLLFTQNGMRNVDGQITGNVGLGQRHFTGDWMLGYNAFYDQNFSRGHKRLGSGIEAWRDYLKLSGNGYYRLSDWRNSRDLVDYDARPANGFDLRAEAWLPAYPALGGRIMYEKYYGDEVALFGKDRRQKNPDAVTAGLSYTPVPLISFTADHKRGGTQNDTRLGLQLTYQIGQSLASHFDASAVSLKRTLAGSGMDLVERNNNIVLEYRKQQLIDLALPKEITGESGKTVPVTYQLTSKYSLAKIVWNDAAVTTAGGKLQDLGGGNYQLVLPKYTVGAANSWPLSGVAYDSRNNTSKVATTTVTVTRPSISAEKSSVTASPETIIADGTSTSVISITLKDEVGAPVTGLAADIAVALKEEPANTPMAKTKVKASRAASAKPASLSEVIEQGGGVYNVTLTAGTRTMLAIVSPALDALALPTVAVNQISDAASATVKDGDLKLVADNAVANASATNSAQARVTDAIGNPVAGTPVTFALSGSAQVAPGSNLTAVSDANGNASLQFISTVAETVNVTATTAVGGSVKVNATFIADKSTAALAQRDLTVDRISAVANGTDAVTYSALIKDAYGNPVQDVRIDWSANGGSLSGSGSVTDADGRATITLSSTVAQMVQTSAAAEGGASVSAPVVSFGADAASGGIDQNDLTVSKNTALANGTDGITYTAVIKDAHGNPLANQTVNWHATVGDLSAATSVTGAYGQATVILTSLQASSAQVSVSLNNKPAVNAPSVSFTADASSAQIGSGDLTVDKVVITGNGVDTATFTALVKDANGNVLKNHNVKWESDRGNLSAGSSITDDSGEATIHLTSTLAGLAQVTASVNNSAPVNAPRVTVTADNSSARIGNGDLTTDKTTALANGTDVVTYIAVVKDANGNPVSGLVVSWSSDFGSLSAQTSTTGSDGRAQITLTSPLAGIATVKAQPGSGSAATAPAVSFNADGNTAVIGSGDLSVDKTTVVANNVDTATYTAQVKDANGNPVPEHAVSWATTKGTLNSASSITNTEGKATIQLRNTKAEAATVTAIVNATATEASVVTFIADATTANLSSGDITTNKTTLFANNTDIVTYTATVKDAYGNPISGQKVIWAGAPASTTLDATAPTNSEGKATATLKGMREQQAIISASLDGGAPVNAPTVTFKMPEIRVANGQAMTAQNITDVLANTEAAFANLYDGHWAKTIDFPAASGLSGKLVKIINKASYASTVSVNGSSFTTVRGTTYIYKSNGTKWERQ